MIVPTRSAAVSLAALMMVSAPVFAPPFSGARAAVPSPYEPGGPPRAGNANGGYHVNRYGYGNYTPGANGGFGGYPPGSDGARILQEQQRRKCQAVPESC